MSASPSSGVNALTGEGLAEALAGANVVVDVSNSPSWADAAVMAFFETSTRNLLAAEKAAGVRHHVALSVVGADRMPDSGYMRAKVDQERLIEAGGVPYTIVRATQFFEFLGTAFTHVSWSTPMSRVCPSINGWCRSWPGAIHPPSTTCSRPKISGLWTRRSATIDW